MDYFEGVVHVAFEGIHQVGVLFEFPVPVVHQFKAFVGQTGRQSQFQHFDARSHLHDQPFLFEGIFRRTHAVFHHHAFTGQPLLVPRGAHDLPQGFLNVVVIMLEVPLARHIDRIAVRLVMGHSAAVRTHGHEIVPHFQQEVVEADMQSPFIGFGVATLHGTTVFLQYRIVSLLIHVGQCRLVDVEKCADLPVMYALVLFLHLLVQFQISVPADDVLRIVAVDVLVPVVEQERNALLVLAYRCAACLGIAVKGEQVGLAPVPVRMQGHEQAVERADGNTFRIKFRKALARSVEPVSPGIRRFVQSRGEQLYLTLLGILFYLRFFFHIPIFFRLQDY